MGISIRFRRLTNRISDRRAHRTGAHLTSRNNAKRCGMGYQFVVQLQLFCNRTRRPAAIASEMGHKQSFPAVLLSSSIPADIALVWFCSCFRRRPSLPEEIPT
jgi:hypothetical protein